MTQKMSSAEFIVLSACTMMLTALGIDIMLPVFDQIRIAFGLTPQSTDPARIISFFFMGQVAQIIFGTLSDRYGRLAILRLGFPLYIIGGVAAAFAPSLAVMYACRFVAGVGASAVFMTTIASVRDRFVGDQMARTMSLILSIFLFTPIYAPFLGIAILKISSWQMVFLTPPIFGAIIFIWSFRLEESLSPEKRIHFNGKVFRQTVASVLGNRIFLRYVTITTLLFVALSSYVSSSEHIVGVIYGKPQLFIWIFAGIGALMSLVAFLNSRISSKFGARSAIRTLLIVYTALAVILTMITFFSDGRPNMAVFFVFISLLLAINLAIEPNSSALALEPMGEKAGVASSVYGTCFFFFGATLGSLISYLMVNTVTPLVISMTAIGLVSVMLAWGK
jgi:DHA1 family bicyclomycin/chloramphenicol resistance-like MFS transporter